MKCASDEAGREWTPETCDLFEIEPSLELSTSSPYISFFNNNMWLLAPTRPVV